MPLVLSPYKLRFGTLVPVTRRDFFSSYTVDALKYRTLVACQKDLDEQCSTRSDYFFRSSQISVFPVCFSDKHFVNSSPGNQHFIRNVCKILEHLP